MLTSVTYTDAVRRAATRELAGISSAVMDDAELDRKIETADDAVKVYLQIPDATVPDGTEPYFPALVNMSNLYTSIAIREGLGGADNASIAKEQGIRMRSLLAAYNKKEPDQGTHIIQRSTGINNMRGTFN